MAAVPVLNEARFGYLKPNDVARLADAYRFSEAAHAGQARERLLVYALVAVVVGDDDAQQIVALAGHQMAVLDLATLRDGAFELARDLLADDRAHRSTHELEHEEADFAADAAEGGGARAIRIAGADLARGAFDLIDVLLAVDAEAERIARLELAVVLLPRAGIAHHFDPALGRHPEVVLAGRTDAEVRV